MMRFAVIFDAPKTPFYELERSVQSSFKYRKIGAIPEGNHPTDDD
jgi:hypothetical protein